MKSQNNITVIVNEAKTKSNKLAEQWKRILDGEQKRINEQVFMSEDAVIDEMKKIVKKRDDFGEQFDSLIIEVDEKIDTYDLKDDDLTIISSAFKSISDDIGSISIDFSMSGTINDEIGTAEYRLAHKAKEILERWLKGNMGKKESGNTKEVYVANRIQKKEKPKKKLGKKGKFAIAIIGCAIAAVVAFLFWYKNIRPKVDISGCYATYEDSNDSDGHRKRDIITEIIEEARSKKGFNISEVYYDKDLRKIVIQSDSSFEQLPDADKLDFFLSIMGLAEYGKFSFGEPIKKEEKISNMLVVRVQKSRYSCYDDQSRGGKYKLYKNSDLIFEKKVQSDYSGSGASTGGSSGTTGSTCPNCNGTGSTKTYGTDSIFEEGTYIECPMCHGTGKV